MRFEAIWTWVIQSSRCQSINNVRWAVLHQVKVWRTFLARIIPPSYLFLHSSILSQKHSAALTCCKPSEPPEALFRNPPSCPYTGHTAVSRIHRMDDRDVAAAPPSVQPSDDPTQTNVDARSASREHVTAAMSGPAPGFGSGPSVEEPQKPQEPQEPREPPPSAQLPTAARARAQASISATRSSTTAPIPGRAPAPVPGHEQPALRVPHFVAPSSYLRFKASHGSAMAAAAPEPTSNPSPPSPPSPLDKDQRQGLVRGPFPPCSVVHLLRRAGLFSTSHN